MFNSFLWVLLSSVPLAVFGFRVSYNSVTSRGESICIHTDFLYCGYDSLESSSASSSLSMLPHTFVFIAWQCLPACLSLSTTLYLSISLTLYLSLFPFSSPLLPSLLLRVHCRSLTVQALLIFSALVCIC